LLRIRHRSTETRTPEHFNHPTLRPIAVTFEARIFDVSKATLVASEFSRWRAGLPPQRQQSNDNVGAMAIVFRIARSALFGS
jgi:hypothetical protein